MTAESEKQKIDHILQSRRKREFKACYACHQRKVKCNGEQPCRTCLRRGHPEICTYDASASRASGQAANRVSQRSESVHGLGGSPARGHNQRQYQGQGPRQKQQEYTQAQGSRQDRSDGREEEYVFSGDNSVMSILQQRTQDANGATAQEVGSVLGLHNTYNNYPFMDSKTPHERWKSLLQILPQRDEVLKYFHFYRLCSYPFNPILVDVDQFESDLCSYLNAHAEGEFRDANHISGRWSTAQSIGHVSLLLATLASGAHYSDMEHPQRTETCQELARRSFQALRLANFLFRASLDTIQTLLVLGNTLQNNGQSDAAWALLGTTVRLAQTLGLHTSESIAHLPEYVRSKAKALWLTIVWQDSLLCLCYDRPNIVSLSGWPSDSSVFSRRNLSYKDIMHCLCRMALDIIKPEVETHEVGRSLDLLTTLDGISIRAEPHLHSREHCKTFHQNLEHLALKMHISLAISILCRPAMKRTLQHNPQYGYEMLRARAKSSLVNASKAFLDFQVLSTVPLRTWSMVHTVLSSTLLLCIWEETRHDQECRDLQQRVIEVFSATEPAGNGDTSSVDDGQWLSERHIRALVMLRNAVGTALNQQDSQENNAEDLENLLPTFSMPNAFPIGLDALGVSPVPYIDSIMNFPLFDLSQESQFL